MSSETRTPRALGALLAALLVSGCGNYSNDDLAFLAAVPRRDELRSKIESDPAAGQALTLAQSQAALALGDRSEFAENTLRAATSFNRGIGALLGLFEEVLQHPPTRRFGATRREWGPFVPKDRPGFEFRVVIERELDELGEPGPSFHYALQVRRRLGGEWISPIEGTYLAAGGGIRKGAGTLSLHTLAARNLGFPLGDLDTLDSLDVVYDTAGDPLVIQLEVVGQSGLDTVRASYEYRERTGETPEKGQAAIRFRLEQNLVGGLLSATEVFQVTSKWLANHAGRAEATILSGDAAGATQIDCWDENFALTYLSKPWESLTLGSDAGCPAVDVP